LGRHSSNVFGVDFSGARDAGKKIWVARGTVDRKCLRIEEIRRGDELRGSGRGRERCLEALRRLITHHPEGVFGFDFPFGLPLVVAHKLFGPQRWSDFLAAFVDRYGACSGTAEQFKLDCWEAAGRKELRRDTDRIESTPFSPYNLRLFRQTFHGILDLLGPLVADGTVSVLPMQPPHPGRPWLVEICPASTLTRLRLRGPSYKGRSLAHRALREGILERLKTDVAMEISDRHLERILLDDHHGDALDSVIAALAVFRTLRDPAFPMTSTSDGEPCQIEEHVYA
jgi:hypothetical protein